MKRQSSSLPKGGMNLLAVALLSSTPAMADEALPGAASLINGHTFSLAADSAWLQSFDLTPRVLGGDETRGSSIGLGYQIVSKPVARDLTADAIIGEPKPARQLVSFEMTAKGLYAARADLNPENLIDASASGVYETVLRGIYLKSAFGAAFEKQQGTGTKALRYEMSQWFGAWARDANDSELLGKIAFARLDPKDDSARDAALGGDAKGYNRWDLEVLAIIPIMKGALQKIEIGHRQLFEPDAPGAIRAAHLDRFKLSSVYFKLDKGFFVAFSKGGLPADKKDAQILQLGWSTNLTP